MNEEWVTAELLNALRNLPQHTHSSIGQALTAAAGTADVWVPGLLAFWVGVLLGCVWVAMTYMGGNDNG